VDNPEKIRTRADRIKTVVEQGAGIVQAMLGFSRSSDEQPAPCDLNAVVDDTLKLLGDRFRREVEVRFERAAPLPEVPAAKDLIQQILLNFIFNAAEAMERRAPTRPEPSAIPDGGDAKTLPSPPSDGGEGRGEEVRFSESPSPQSSPHSSLAGRGGKPATHRPQSEMRPSESGANHQHAETVLGAPTAQSHPRKQVILATRAMDQLPADIVLPPALASSYVSVSVRDCGSGITPENLPRIFEPFFTTKALSTRRGTGLGLSMVYELARKMEAGLAVESVVDQGSTFTLILPMRDLPPPKVGANELQSTTPLP
jgi:signal transduction histidine kinase